jgi:ABC-type transport system substrate-binding protein
MGMVGTIENWDPAITSQYSFYRGEALQILTSGNSNYSGGTTGKLKHEEWEPVLCTNWSIEYWPEEMNSQGFKNRGGIKAINYTLRNGVKFHDGSNWNATVMKWNIDRMYMITGNLTGNGDLSMSDTYWKKAERWEPYFTPNWNLSSFIEGPTSYNGINYSKIELEGLYPLVKQVTIIEDQPSGGRIRIEWNDWNSLGNDGIIFPMISMHTYKDFYDKGIYGVDNDDILYPDHMIGTGPYKYIDHDGVAGRGYMEKFTDYWNRTALEAQGWYNINYIDFFFFNNTQTLNNALISHTVDFVHDGYIGSSNPSFYYDVMANPRINFIEWGHDQYVTAITLNCINETWWSDWPWPAQSDVESWYPTNYSSGNRPSGTPRALRKAMSFAFDYDTYINVTLNERAVRAGGVVGVGNLYHNESIPIASYNLTIARNTLLNDNESNFYQQCADRGLTESSSDAEWQLVADTVPIWTLDFYWDDQFQGLKDVLETSLNNIGVALKDPA